jgi:glycosyltransferase involved in cell wall biosynthesis
MSECSETISIILPTRKRPKGLRELFTTLSETTKYKNSVEVCLVIDDDDVETIQFVKNYDGDLSLKEVVIPRGKHILGEWWDIGYKIATGSIMMLCADDFRFRTYGWDGVVYDEFDKYPDKILMVYGDDKFVSKNLKIATFSFVHRRWIENSPFWLPPYFTTDYVDTWISDIAEKLGRKIFVEGLVVEHMHFLAGKKTPDAEANQDAMKRIMHEKMTEENKKIYFSEEKTKERMAHFERLKKLIE